MKTSPVRRGDRRAEEIQLDVDDVLILATKTQQANEALVTWTDALVHQNDRPIGTAGERLPIFIALNGVAAEAMAHRYFRRVYGVCVWTPAVHLAPGEVIIRSTPHRDAPYRPRAGNR